MNKTENENNAVTETADNDTAKASAAGEKPAEAEYEPEYVKPIKKSEKIDPKKMPEESFDYVIPEHTFQEHMRNPEAARIHSGQTKMASKEEMEEASEGFLFLTSYSEKVHHHHHHSSSHSSSKEKGAHDHRSSGSSAKEKGADLVDPTKLPPRKHRSSGDPSKKHRRRRKSLWVRILIIAVIVLLSAAVVLGGSFFVLREVGRRNLHNYDDIVIVTPTEQEEEKTVELMDVIDSGRTIGYEGETYILNENVVSVVVIGNDHDFEEGSVQSMGDSINIVTLDTETGKLSVISVSRDTMADVNIFSDEGAYIDTERLQLAYAYSFGNRYISGGENTLSALSKLFFGLPLDNYFAIDMDALISLNDAIGGVTLTSSIDFTSQIDGSYISAGDTVTLYGRDAESYVRSRDINELDSNNARMQRQQEYIRAFFAQVIPMIKKDFSLVSKFYNILQVNSETTLDLPKVTYLASTAVEKMKGAPEIEYLSIKGEVVKGDYAEFIADDHSILETMLKVFYTKKNE